MVNIPIELAELDRWVVWKFELKQNGSPAKVPFNARTKKRASVAKDLDWCDVATAMTAYKQDDFDGIGFVFVAEDDICGVDIDNCRDSFGNLTPEAISILKQLDSYSEVSPSGRGVKIFCRGRLPLDSGRKCKLDARQRLELYTSARYFTFTGEALKNCKTELSEASDGLVAIVQKYLDQNEKQPEKVACVRPLNAVLRASAYAKTMEPSIAGDGGHDRAFHFCCRMLNGFDLTVEEFWPIVDEWNDRCEPPWSTLELNHKIDQALKVGKQEQRGYMFGDDLQTVSTGVAEFHDWFVENETQWLEKHEFPVHLLPHSGLLADICDHINRTAFRKQPVLSMSAAISLMSLALSRKICDELDTFTNTYIINLALTGEGKNNPQRQMMKMIESVDFDLALLVGDEVTSDTAIENDLYRHGTMLYLKDEYGAEWKGHTGRAPWLHSVNTVLMKLWGKADGTHRCKTKAADSKPRLIIGPCLSLSGWTTPGMFWPTVTADHLTDGFLARLLLFDVTDVPSIINEEQSMEQVPKALTDRLRYWFNYQGEMEFDPDNPNKMSPLRIERTPKAREINQEAMLEAEKYRDNDMEFGIWKRMPEKAARLSIIAAASRVESVQDLIINADDMAWGRAVASWCTSTLVARTKQLAGGETLRERQLNQVNEKIQTAWKASKNLDRGQLRRQTKGIQTKDFDDIIAQLVEMNEIAVESVKTKGRKRTIYKPHATKF